MDDSLVQIQPLSQSRYEQMACGFGYRAVHVHSMDRASSIWSEGGNEVHDVLSVYIEHLAETRQSTDVEYFDILATGVRPESRDGLDRARNSLVVDPDKILGTEQYIGLDKNFALVVMERVQGGHRTSSDPRIEYEGTLDLIVLPAPTEAEISDWKNHFFIAAPDTFQVHFYPLLLFCALPSLEVIRFRLEYLRWGVGRSVTFTRSDVPRLKKMAILARNRQRKLTLLAKEPKPTPHKGCMYCPLLLAGCPMEKVNPYARLSREERLRYQLYLDAARETNLTLLKEWAEEKPISIHDENHITYTASFVPRSRTSYTLDNTLPILDAWDKGHPDDQLRPQLLIGASELNSLAKATKKRPGLATELSNVAMVTPSSEFQITREALRPVAPEKRSAKARKVRP